MKLDPSTFATRNRSAAKSPRFVVKIEFATSAIYLSSHDDIANVPATHLPACLIEPSITSQKLNPDQGRAEIGAASFSVADLDGAFTAAVYDRLAEGEGLRDKTCRFYLGYEGMPWAEFILVGTQIIKEAAFDRGAYQVDCNDIQRAARKDIFTLAETTITATVEAADTTINVVSTAGFERVKHGTSYSDAASSTVGYLKLKEEVVRYTGTTATSFTGCTRGVLGTVAGRYVADGATPAARREKVTEYVYLELPGPKLIYALLTGVLYGDSANLPESWHLGISTSLVRTSDYTGVGSDLWNLTDDNTGVVLRFEGLAKTDGKAFIETELLRLLGLYMPVYADGLLGLRRMTRVLADAPGILTLDERNSVRVGTLQHDMESLHNVFRVLWNWNGKEYTRTTTYIDANSVAKHGRSTVLELKFKGLYGGRHTDGLIFKLLDSIRDRYTSPPVRVQVEALHSLNRIEVGDVVRCRHASLRDFTAPSIEINRAFEVQSVSVNHRTGAVSLGLFGSTATPGAEPPTQAVNSLPDAFYTATGTDLASVWTISGGVVSGGPYTLAGGTDLTASGSVWYYNGDLTIPEGVTVNLTGNVQIRVKGYLTLNGSIIGTGGGHAGVADNTSATNVIAGTPGWVGNSRGLDGVDVVYPVHTAGMVTQPPATTVGLNASFPYMALEVVGNALKGLPTDLRGTGGGPGGKVVRKGSKLEQGGGTGAAGGAGLCTISRGFGVGASATINLSGLGAAAQPYVSVEIALLMKLAAPVLRVFPGTGGAGGPGSYFCLIDGGLLSTPDLSGRFVARTGALAVPAYKTALSGTEVERHDFLLGPFAGYIADPSAISNADLSFSAHRIQYVPAPETPAGDSDTLPPVEGLDVTSGSSGFTLTFTPGSGTPDGTVYEVWLYTAASPFASATKVAEGASTAFFIPRNNTTTVYVWVRARRRNSAGVVIYSTTTPAGNGQPAAAAGTAGTYATANPSSVSASAASSSLTTASVTASLVGDTATTYSWARQSGSTSISVTSASAASTTFSATGVATGATVSAVFRCTINGTYTVDVVVDCTNTTSALQVTASPSSVTKTQDASSITTDAVTASATGGSGGYSYAWTKVTGGSIAADSASSAATTFTATGMAASESRSATFRVTVTDGSAATATFDVSVTVTRAAFSVSIAPTELYAAGTKSTVTTDVAYATPSGGVAPYTYAWTKVSGDTINIINPTNSWTQFQATYLDLPETRTATFRVTATDSAAATTTRDIVVVIERYDQTNPG
jgi:hypothetical protein